MRKIQENLVLSVSAQCDVLVVGGGFAGISAALAAARHGKNVILLEREYMVGGLGTAGLVTIYLPICDGRGHCVSRGIAEELLRLPLAHGLEGRKPHLWLSEASVEAREKGQRYMAQYNPHICAILMEQLLRKAGVHILYGTVACAVELKSTQIRSVIIENKSGRSAIEVESVIDCTGDADIAHFAKMPTALYPEKNPLAAWYYYQERSSLCLNQLGACDVNDNDPTVVYQRIQESFRISGVDAWENSQFMQDSHDEILKDILRRRAKGADCVPTTIPTIPQVRMTRRILGADTVVAGSQFRYQETSVGLFSDWTKRGPVFELPFGALRGGEIYNLLTAGRCISADDTMWNLTRVIPVCVVSGQAAGTAAGITNDFSRIDIPDLQAHLRQDGIYIHCDEVDI